jgi:hypothetical protein
MEEEPREAPRQPLLAPPVLEAEPAHDPEITSVEAHDPAPLVQPPAIARERPAQWECLDVPQRRHAILGSHTSIIARAIGAIA